ncbi:Protein of unknown function [Gryllus bimaculatus]|nr:Protein of unknown function [Gryllus bimaculatus]
MQCLRAARWSLVALLLAVAAQSAHATPVAARDLAVAEQAAPVPLEAVEVILEPEVFGAELPAGGERDKRALEAVLVKHLGVKNYVLGLLFGNTAMRTQRFVEALKPVLSNKLGVTTRGRSIRDSVDNNFVRRR